MGWGVDIFDQFRCAMSKTREAYSIGTVSEFAISQAENGQKSDAPKAERPRKPCGRRGRVVRWWPLRATGHRLRHRHDAVGAVHVAIAVLVPLLEGGGAEHVGAADGQTADVEGPEQLPAPVQRTVAGVGALDVDLQAIAARGRGLGAELADAGGVGHRVPVRVVRRVGVRRVVRKVQTARVRGRDRRGADLGRGAGGGDEIAPVAVLVDAVVRDFGGAGVDPNVAVVAVRGVLDLARGHDAAPGGARGLVAEPVAVRVWPGLRAGEGHDVAVVVVRDAVAVVVHAVADLERVRVDGRVRVVAVVVVVDVAAGHLAHHDAAARVAVEVRVVVLEELLGVDHVVVGIVHRAIAVVVDGVAGLDAERVDGRVGVVAVGIVHDPAGAEAADERRGGRIAVAVEIRIGVGGDGRAGDGGVGVVAVLEHVGGLVDLDVLSGQRAGDDAETAGVERRGRIHVVVAVAVVVRTPGLGAAERGVAGVVGDREVQAVLDGRAGGQGLGRGHGVARAIANVENIGIVGVAAGAEEREQEPKGPKVADHDALRTTRAGGSSWVQNHAAHPGWLRATFDRFSADWEGSRLPWAYACENSEYSRKSWPMAGPRNLTNSCNIVKGCNAKRGQY